MKRIDIINGANLNMIGKREKNVYGDVSFEDICERSIQLGKELDLDIKIFQSNIEGEIINYIHSLYNKSNGIIINPGAYTHYSIAIRDALLSVPIPFIEIHLSNIYSREEFRRKSVLSDVAKGIISGFGEHSYYLGIRAMKELV
jgi:3-dehydroquinate dehydratase-2